MSNTLTSLINAALSYQMDSMFTCLPCVVVGIGNISQSRVDVQPVINSLDKDGSSQNRPPILDIPVVFPSSSTSSISFPINIGDTVLCVFAQNSIDNFVFGDGSFVNPSDYRRFDKSDAIAIPGLFPFNKSKNLSNNTDLVVAHNGSQIRIKGDGEIALSSPIKVSVDTPLMTLTGDLEVTGTSTAADHISDGISGKTHRHSGVQSGGSNTNTPVQET